MNLSQVRELKIFLLSQYYKKFFLNSRVKQEKYLNS